MILYRYQPINKFTLTNLALQKNWIADPFRFNDPFEFRLSEIYYFNSEGKLSYLDKNEYNARMLYMETLRKFGVVCYSGQKTNKLMWSHYADHHKGLCLGFEITAEQAKRMKKVRYQGKLGNLKFSRNKTLMSKELIKIATTKSNIWKYEQEYRQIYSSKSEHVEYPGKLREIVFGCRASKNDIDTVNRIVRPVKNQITFSKTFIIKNTFSLGEEEIPTPKKGKLIIPDRWKEVMEA